MSDYERYKSEDLIAKAAENLDIASFEEKRVLPEPEDNPEIVINAGDYIASNGMSIPVIIRTQRGGMIERLWNEELLRRQGKAYLKKLDDPNVIDVEVEVMKAEEGGSASKGEAGIIGQTKQSTIEDE